MRLNYKFGASPFLLAAALVWGIGDSYARNVGHGSDRAGGTAGAFIEGSGATFSPLAGSSSSLVTPYGVFTLGTYRTDTQPGWCNPRNPIPNGCSDFYALYLNGHRIAPYAQRVVVSGGKPFYFEEDQNGWQEVNWTIQPNGGIYSSGPVLPGYVEIPPPPTYPPVTTPVSADGTTRTAPTGTLVNQYGTWSWGNPQTGGYEVWLNGTTIEWNAPHLVAVQFEINSNGQMFIQHPDLSWHVYLDYVEQQANAPTGQVIPLALNISPGAGSPSCGDLVFRMPNSVSGGTPVATLTVTTSDGSPFAGTASVGISNNSEILYNATVNMDGTVTLTTHMSPVTTAPFSANNAAITVTQNGTSVSISTTLAVNAGC